MPLRTLLCEQLLARQRLSWTERAVTWDLLQAHPVGAHGQQVALQANQVRRRLRHLRRRQLQRRRIVLSQWQSSMSDSCILRCQL